MAKVGSDEIVMVGGLTIPKDGTVKHNPADSTTWKLNENDKKWSKCYDCDLTKRAGHAMCVHNEKVYIVGGFRFEDNLAKKLFSLTQVVELTIHISGSILPTFVSTI